MAILEFHATRLIAVAFRVVAGLALVYLGMCLGHTVTNARAQFDGELQACSTIVFAFQQAGQLNPALRCEEYQGQVSMGFPEHPEAPRYRLDGRRF